MKPTQTQIEDAMRVLAYINKQDNIEYMSKEDKALQLVQELLDDLHEEI